MPAGRPWQIGIAVVAVAFTTVFFIDFCNAVYLCGCDHLWAGADAQCNVHAAGSKHCPWCSLPPFWMNSLYFGIVIPQVFAALRPARWRWQTRLGVTMMLFPLIGGVMALTVGMATGYWD